MKKLFFNLLCFFSIVLLVACEKNEPGPQGGEVDEVPSAFENGVFVMNEGNFGTNNGSISFLNLDSWEISNGLFESANNGERLGDVVQSMTIHKDHGYIVVNNSQKVVKVDMKDLSLIQNITGFTSPRYLTVVNDDKAYVTNLKLSNDLNPIDIVDLNSGELIGEIAVSGWTEQMILWENKVFVGNMTNGRLEVIDINEDQVIEQIDLSKEPNSMVVDRDNNLWVLCSGGINDEQPAIYKIDSETMSAQEVPNAYNVSSSPTRLTINESRDELFFLMDNEVYRMKIDDETMPNSPFIQLNSFQYPYGLSVLSSNELLINDAKDFQQNGTIHLFSADGNELRELTAGEAPSFLLVNN